jgi:hypothetical protein
LNGSIKRRPLFQRRLIDAPKLIHDSHLDFIGVLVYLITGKLKLLDDLNDFVMQLPIFFPELDLVFKDALHLFDMGKRDF